MFIRWSGILYLAMGATLAVGAVDGPIHPIGSENLGYLLVKEPAWTSPEEKHVFDYTVEFNREAVRPGFAKRLSPTTGTLNLVSTEFGAVQKSELIEIKKRQTTTVDLSGLLVRWNKNSDGPLAVNFGPRPKLSVEYNGLPLEKKVKSDAWSGEPKQGLVVLPGKYKFDFNISSLDPVEETVVAGKVHRLDITPPDRRATVIVRAPKRTYDDPEWSKCETENRNFLILRHGENTCTYAEPNPYHVVHNDSKSENIHMFSKFTLKTDQTFKLFPLGKSEHVDSYEYVVNNLAFPIKPTPGQTIEIPVKRIEVDDVLVTKENGEQYFASGRFVVYRRNAANSDWDLVRLLTGKNKNDCSGGPTLGNYSWPTKRGIDVIPGYYKVVVTYSTAEGPGTQEFELDYTK